MRKLLYFFIVCLPLCVYPVFLRVPVEISQVFGHIEIDLFSWYRMWLIVITGTLFALWASELGSKVVLFYWLALIMSTAFSYYQRTAIYGSPWVHEGFIAIIGYMGLYLAGKKIGLTKGLERSLDTVIITFFVFTLIQIAYGDIFDFPPLKWMMTGLHAGTKYQVIKWPLSSLAGCADHLGLFTALFFPYTAMKKKRVLCFLVLYMAVCSCSRGAWLSIGMTSLLMGRQAFFRVAAVALLLAIPFHKPIMERVTVTLNEIHYPIRDTDLSGRAYIWKRSIHQLKQTILLGRGPATFGLYFPQHEERAENVFKGGLVVDRPHNMYLNIWTGTGLISLLILSWITFKILFNAADPALEIAAIGFLITAFFTDSVLSVTPYFMIFLGILSRGSK